MKAATRHLFLATAGAATLMTALAGWQVWRQGTPVMSARHGEKLFPLMAAQSPTIAMIVLTKGEDMTTLARQDGQWVVKGEDEVRPADVANIRRLLIQFAQSAVKEPKTNDEARLPELGLGDPAAGGKGSGTQIQVFGEYGDLLAEIIAGDEGKNFRGTSYVRFPHDAQSWLVDGVFAYEANAEAWSDATLFSIPPAQVKSVRIQHPDGEELFLLKERDDAVGFTLGTVLRPGQMPDRAAMDAVAGALDGLRFLAATPGKGWRYSLEKTVEVSFRTFDGRLVTAWVQPQQDGTSEVMFSAEARLPQQHADWLARHRQDAHWIYRLDRDKTRLLISRLGDVVK